MEFTKAFNEKTKDLMGFKVPTVITVYTDRSFTFITKQPPASALLMKAANLKKGTDNPLTTKVGKLTKAQLMEVVERKIVDLNTNDKDVAMNTLAGTAPQHLVNLWKNYKWRIWKMSKRYKQLQEKIDNTKQYSVSEATTTLKDLVSAKFDETVEMALNLNVDPRHADQMVRGAIVLPHGTGKTVRVAVFAKGAKADEAKAAGADIVGTDDLVAQIK